ncbi:MAG: hypothetical protein IJI27_00750 [Oscillospiraceae bacterium]|nr:hypothetical protein [Oscillospiraceae bacterium]
MNFADIHNHILFGVDDGARSEADMYALIDASYADGVRHLCFTPHYHTGYFGEHQTQIDAAFALAQSYCAERYPDLRLYLGNELRYERSCIDWVEKSKCRTLNNTQYLLVDFLYHEPADHIMQAMIHILNNGYTPVLAHVERYEDLRMNMHEVEQLRSWGVIIQIDAQSVLGGLGHGAKRRSRRILKMQMADLIASDAHDLNQRPPLLRECCDLIEQRYGKTYAKSLLLETPLRILRGESINEQEG